MTQKRLEQNQIDQFKIYHGSKVCFNQFMSVVNGIYTEKFRVIDVGGGVGFFASDLKSSDQIECIVLDMDEDSVRQCKSKGIDAFVDDALNLKFNGKANIASFNLILHHLIGASERVTLSMQKKALLQWKEKADYLFVHEFSYESYFYVPFSGYLIYLITSNQLLSLLGGFVAKFIPSLKANTFGVGVRFRSHQGWLEIFDSIGLELVSVEKGHESAVSLPRRLLGIKSIRLDSFLLRFK